MHLNIIETVKRLVGRYYGVSVAEIEGRSKLQTPMYARMMAMAVIRKVRPEVSLPRIGRAFDNRHHTTVLNAVHRIDELRKDQKWAYDLDVLAEQFRQISSQSRPPPPIQSVYVKSGRAAQ